MALLQKLLPGKQVWQQTAVARLPSLSQIFAADLATALPPTSSQRSARGTGGGSQSSRC